jgi:hypothetical protein
MRVTEETIRLPAGFAIGRLPEPRTIDGAAARLETRFRTDGPRTLAFHSELEIKKREIPVREQETVRKVVKEAKSLAGDFVVLERR